MTSERGESGESTDLERATYLEHLSDVPDAEIEGRTNREKAASEMSAEDRMPLRGMNDPVSDVAPVEGEMPRPKIMKSVKS